MLVINSELGKSINYIMFLYNMGILPHNDYHAMLLGYRAATKEELKNNDFQKDLSQLLKLDVYELEDSIYLTKMAERIVENKTDLTPENHDMYVRYISNMLLNLSMRFNEKQISTVNRFTLAIFPKALSSARYTYNLAMSDLYIKLNLIS